MALFLLPALLIGLLVGASGMALGLERQPLDSMEWRWFNDIQPLVKQSKDATNTLVRPVKLF